MISDNFVSGFAEKAETLIPESIRRNSETVFIAVMTVFIVLLSCKNTTMDLNYPDHPAILLVPAMLFAVILRLLERLRDYRRIIAGLAVAFLYCISFLVNRSEFGNYSYLVYIGLLTIGCIGVNYEKLLKIWCIAVGSVIAVTFCAASIGAAENLVYYVGGWRHQIRGSLGVVYPTDCATWVLFFLMMLWIAYKRIPVWVIFIMTIGSVCFSARYCDSTTSFSCSILFCIAIVYEVIERRMIKNHRVTDILIVLLAPLLSIFMFILVFLYGKEVKMAYVIDEKLHRRLYFGWDAIQKYGIRPFGAFFEMEGFGGKLVHDMSKYNFLDSSYVNILIRYGIIIFVTVMAMWLYTEWRAVKIGNRRILLVMAIISIHSFEEHHFMEIIYNPLIIMSLADYGPEQREDHEQMDGTTPGNWIYSWLRENAGILAGLIVIAIIIPALPYCFSLMRTVTDLTADPSGRPDMPISLLLIILLLGTISALVYGVAKIAKHVTRKGVLCVLGGFISVVMALISCEFYISTQNETYISSFAQERRAIEYIIGVNTHPVYIDTYPEIYRREYPTLKSSAFAGADLARHPRATVITDVLTESDCFFKRGYLMTRISDNTVVYSNDEPVLKELEKEGWHITGYYSVSRKARINDDGSALIEDLVAGRYTFSTELELISLGTDTADKIGEIKVITSEETNANGAEQLYISDFSNGKAHKDIVCNIADSPEVRITVECTDGFDVKMTSTDYVKSYDIDVHDYYNDNYQVVRSEYFDAKGNRIAGSDGASALEYEYDDAGNQSVIRYYGIDDKPLIVGSGYAEIHRVYDDLRRVVSESYYGIDGKPKALSSGQASDERILDVKGNITIQKYYGVDGKPVLLKAGYAEIHRGFDDKGHIIKEEYYDVKGNPLVLGYGYAAVVLGYDDNDNVVFTGYYDSAGAPTIISLGYSEIHRKFDDIGNTLEESYYDMDGHLMMIKKGYAMIKWEYDSVGRVVKESYFDTQEKPVALTSGQASDTREYDSAGNCVVQRYYSGDGSLVMLGSGYSERHREYNDKAQLIRETYYDTSGKAAVLKAGYSSVEYKYDEYGNNIGERYFDMSGKPVMINTGYSTIRRYYDDRKHLYREEYLGINDKPVLNTSGYHAFERKYDEADHVVREEYVDDKGTPVNNVLGYAAMENSYDKEGWLVLKRYMDTEGQLTSDVECMVAEIHYEYDDWGHIVKEKYFGTDGRAVENNQGYALMENVYNESGLIIEQRYYGTDGNPVSCISGYAKVIFEYNHAGLSVAEWYYDTEGRPVTCIGGYFGLLKEYNERGSVCSQTVVDSEGSPMISASRYAKIEREYNDRGKVIGINYFDTDDEPVNISSGYACVRRSYDEWGRVIREVYFGTDDNLISDSSGVASLEREYDSRDLVLREIYFDTNGKISDNSSGISEYQRGYGNTGLLVREEINNISGNRQETAGYAAIDYEYDDKGMLSGQWYEDEKGAPVTIGSGYAMMEYRYDDLRNRISERFLDISGNYFDNTSGFCGIIKEYEGRNCVRESFVDSNGSFTNVTAGYCTLQREYDRDRNLVSVSYLDKNNAPAINSDVGYSVVKYEYDEYRNRIGEYYYDTMGNPIVAANGCRYIHSVYDKDRNVILQYRK